LYGVANMLKVTRGQPTSRISLIQSQPGGNYPVIEKFPGAQSPSTRSSRSRIETAAL
jgi:hypothetical protein